MTLSNSLTRNSSFVIRNSLTTRRIRRYLLALLIVIALAIFIVWRLSWAAPAWYAPPNPHDETVLALADTVEYRLVEEAQKVRPASSELWTLRVRQEHINAWLSARLQKWIAHDHDLEWPAQLGTPQVRIEPAGISLALPIGEGTHRRTLLARFTTVMNDGIIRVTVDRVALGRVAMPGEPLSNLLSALSKAAPDAFNNTQIKSLIDALSHDSQINPILELPDGRRIQLLDVRLNERWIDLTATTLPPAVPPKLAPHE